MKDIGSIIEGQKLIHKLQPSSVNADDFAYDKYHPMKKFMHGLIKWLKHIQH